MSKSKAPFVVRWRNGVMDDPNPVLTWKALVAAMALVRYANVLDGRDCYPGKAACARVMRVSENTIQRGWDELREAGWLYIHPLPASRRQSQGALKELRWPPRDPGAEGTRVLSEDDPGAHSTATITGNQGGPSDPSGTAPHPGKQCRKHADVDLHDGTCWKCDEDAYWNELGGRP
jgi:hypothetical protein